MTHGMMVPGLGALGLAMACAATATAQEMERFVLGDGPAAVYNLAGEIEVVAGTGSDVIVEVTRGGRDGGALRVEVGDVGRVRALRVIYPEDRIAYPRMSRGSRTTMRVRGDGTFFGNSRGGDRVTISGSGGMEAYADLRVMVPAGRAIDVYLGVGRATARDVSADVLLDLGAATAEAENIRGTLRIDTGSGSVRVRSVEGETEIDTGSGGVDAVAVRGRALRIDTGSGRVTVDDATVDRLDVDTGSGSIRVRGARAPSIRLDTGSGSVNAELLADVDDLVVDSGSGSVTLEVPAELGGQIEIDTGSGGINLDIPVMVTRRERDYLRGSLGDGDGRIRIDTGSGSVRIRGH